MRKLATANNIIWVNWHCSRRPTIRPADLRSIMMRLGQIQKGVRRVHDAITVVTPWQLPLPGSPWARQLNRVLVRRAVRSILRTLPPQPVQLWSFAPDVSDLVGSFNEELALYYCVDAFGEFSGYDRELIQARERELMAACDVVVTTSPPLYEAKRAVHPNVHCIEHGVDHEHLSQALQSSTEIPADIRHLPRPIYGFVGVVGDWVDVELIAGLARQNPRASVVIIGPTITGRGSGANLPNVHWLGGRPHALLPNYLKAFDVALIPFRQVPLTHNANPIKLYEYLAAGVPTVSTFLPAVKPVRGSVWLADTAAAAAAACEQAMQHNTPAERAARSQLMLVHSWHQRLEELSAIVEQTLACRQQPRSVETVLRPHLAIPTPA